MVGLFRILIFITVVRIILELRMSKGDVCKMNMLLIVWVSFCTLDFFFYYYYSFWTKHLLRSFQKSGSGTLAAILKLNTLVLF